MTEKEIAGMWNYYLSLEDDLSNTSQYIEPSGQETVYSFEFAKILILACTEVESVFKAICKEIEGKQVSGDMGTYKATILGKYPKIVTATVTVNRLGRNIEPFSGWDVGPLSWWSAYQSVKHNRGSHFADATYINAVTAVSALYISIFYLAKMCNITFKDYNSEYIDSEYCHGYLLVSPFDPLPGFEKDHVAPDSTLFQSMP